MTSLSSSSSTLLFFLVWGLDDDSSLSGSSATETTSRRGVAGARCRDRRRWTVSLWSRSPGWNRLLFRGGETVTPSGNKGCGARFVLLRVLGGSQGYSPGDRGRCGVLWKHPWSVSPSLAGEYFRSGKRLHIVVRWRIRPGGSPLLLRGDRRRKKGGGLPVRPVLPLSTSFGSPTASYGRAAEHCMVLLYGTRPYPRGGGGKWVRPKMLRRSPPRPFQVGTSHMRTAPCVGLGPYEEAPPRL